MNRGFELIAKRLHDLGYAEEFWKYDAVDYIDDIIDILNEYKIELSDLEDVFTYEENYEDKKDIIDNSDGMHIEEEA